MGMCQNLQMPADLTGKSFLEIGCWEGRDCVEAVKRGARPVLGVDLCTCEALADNVKAFDFRFVHMDIFSEKASELPAFDIVLCASLLYHVENPLALIFRLRKLTNDLLFVETVVHDDGDKPTMLLYPTNELDGNFSNWWALNRRCLHNMLQIAGFAEIEPVFDGRIRDSIRYGVRARAVGSTDFRKILPRAEERMSLAGGRR